MPDDAPLTFDSVEEAKSVFEYGRGLFISTHTAQTSSDSAHSHADIIPNISIFEALMSRYSFALQAFVKSKSPSFTPRERIAVAVLKLNLLSSYLSVYIELSPPDKKASWKNYMPQFEEMLDLAEKVLSFISTTDDRGPTTFFCLDMGIVSPLYTLASQCGDPTIRRKAITLLRSTSRQEGLWNSFFVAKAIERIMDIEERALGGICGCTDDPDRVMPSNIEPLLGIDGNGGWLRKIRQEAFADSQVKFVEGLLFGRP